MLPNSKKYQFVENGNMLTFKNYMRKSLKWYFTYVIYHCNFNTKNNIKLNEKCENSNISILKVYVPMIFFLLIIVWLNITENILCNYHIIIYDCQIYCIILSEKKTSVKELIKKKNLTFWAFIFNGYKRYRKA